MSYNYNPSSQKAEEFINHEEILETLSYAEKNKNNVELIDQDVYKRQADHRRHLAGGVPGGGAD